MDSTDIRILEILKGNARMSFQELGRRTGISRVAAMKRVRKLEREGIIRKYNTYICREDEITMLLDIVTKPEAFDEVLDYCLNQTVYVRQIFRTTNENHIHMVVVSDSVSELKYLTRRIRSDCREKIKMIDFCAVREVVKDVYGGIRIGEWTKPDSERNHEPG